MVVIKMNLKNSLLTQKESRKKRKNTEYITHSENSEKVDLNLTMLVIILNVNGINMSVKS